VRENDGVTRRALLIGSQTYGLRGCNADVALMREVLAARDFEVDVRVDGDATRAGVLDGFEQLISGIRAGDAAVVYYSGHGGRVARPDFEERKAAGQSVHYQFVVPFDMEDSDQGDFRGLLSEELTVLQRRMTDAFRALGDVPNVTTILDCCHSGYLARDAEALRKSIDADTKAFRLRGLREHLAALGPQVELAGLATNPDAVRIVACQPEQSAFELPSQRGGRHGALTDAIATVLDGLGPAPVPWGVIGDLVRRRVRTLVPEQRPDVEGPGDRIVFSAESAPATSALPVAAIGHGGVNGIGIEAAALLGVAVGDEFDLIVPGQSDPIGSATVTSIEGGNALLHASSDAATAALAGQAVAVPRHISVPRVLVHLDVHGPGADALAASIGESTRLGVGTDPATALATVTAAPEGFEIHDRAGARWRTKAFADTPAGRNDLLGVLDSLAVGHRLLDLPPGEGASALGPVVTIEFGTVDGGQRHPLAPNGERLAAGAHVFLTIRNTGTEPLFVWVFDVGVSGRSSLLTNAAPSGTLLGAAGAEDDTTDLWGATGEPLFWPADVPTEAPVAGGDPARPETFVVLVADRRSDLSSLASGPGTARGTARSTLDAILAEARTGTREVAPSVAGEPSLRYRIDPVSFLLMPT